MAPWLFRTIFFLVLASIVFFTHLYLYRRLVRDVTTNRVIRRVTIAAMVALALALPMGRFALRNVLPPAVSAIALSWWGVVIYASLALLVIDAVRLAAGLFLRRKNPALAAAALPGSAPVLSGVPSLSALDPESALAADGTPVDASTTVDAEEPADRSARAESMAQAQDAPRQARDEREGSAAPPVDFTRRQFVSRAVAASALAVGGGLTTLGLVRAWTPPAISEVPIRLAGLPKALEGFTIVQLSDLHIGNVIRESFVDQLVQASNAVKPDLVAITGDLVDGSPDELGAAVARLRNLRSRHGTFFVSGNHDYYSGWERWAPVLTSMDMRVLRNERVSVGDAAASFDVLGVEDWGSRWSQHSDYDLDKAVAGRTRDRASVLLAHQPFNLEGADAAGIGLQLSGHTHGGQLFPGTIIAGLIWGDRVAGLSRTGGTQLYTSRGCGFVGPPMRVDSPPEVVKIVLLPA